MRTPRVAIALDVPDLGAADRLVEELGPDAELYKVGLELFTAEGPAVVRALRERGKEVFLDLKLHDIPATVGGAVAAAARSGASLLTVHAAGGGAMLEAAAEAAEAAGSSLRLLGVTVLTSLDREAAARVWGRPVGEMGPEVLRLARLATDSGLDGLVCSPLEAADLRRELGPDALLVTPGIRPDGSERHDQARTATPGEAVRAGADVLVVGRAVTRAPDPAGALAEVMEAVRGEEK